jgi:hypothetical protein
MVQPLSALGRPIKCPGFWCSMKLNQELLYVFLVCWSWPGSGPSKLDQVHLGGIM